MDFLKGEGRSAKRHYPTMPTKAIAALPAGEPAYKSSTLWLWTINSRFQWVEVRWRQIDDWAYPIVFIEIIFPPTRRGRPIAVCRRQRVE